MRSIISKLEQKASDIAKVSASNRSAFTLVELMVVVAIMAILGALVAGVVVKAIEAQKKLEHQDNHGSHQICTFKAVAGCD